MATTCTVAALPTLHGLHRTPAFAHADYAALRRAVLAFAPAALCGEVRPADWAATDGGRRPGYCGPREYRECLLPLCREHGIPFLPVDDYDDELLALARRMEEVTCPGVDALMAEVLRLAARPALGLTALLDPALFELLRAKHRLAQLQYPELEGPTWSPRNLRIAANVCAAAARHLGQRLLVTVGLEHAPFLLDHLALCPLVELVSPLTPP